MNMNYCTPKNLTEDCTTQNPTSILGSWIKEYKKWRVEDILVYNLYDVTNRHIEMKPNSYFERIEIKEEYSSCNLFTILKYNL
jgi:hypothetical protein